MESGGGVEGMEMCRVWNCGIGMVLVVGQDEVSDVMYMLDGAMKIGSVKAGQGVEIRGLETWN
jgi:phosphoribosylamine--glycine ligase/phosphoribosylformylglycinamidine cyclo-ligase